MVSSFRLLPLLFLITPLSAVGEETALPSPEPLVQEIIPGPADKPIVWLNPANAVLRAQKQPVAISLGDELKLTPAQRKTASAAPVPRSGGRGWLYPEDRISTAEEKAEGAALTERQRRQMRAARRRSAAQAADEARREAEAYNCAHDDEITRREQWGDYIIIRLSTQEGMYFKGGLPQLKFPVCTGRSTNPTPPGHFHIMEKEVEHRSNKYNNAPMPYFQRLTNDGVGLHQGALNDSPSSHGCIRLSRETAKYLYEHGTLNMPVFIEK